MGASEMITTEIITMKRNNDIMERIDNWKLEYLQIQEQKYLGKLTQTRGPS